MGITTSGALDLHIDAVRVAGTVTLNGQPLPNVGSSTRIDLEPADKTASAVAAYLDGQGHYATMILAGKYDVTYGADGNDCTQGTTAFTPCNGGVLKSQMGFTANGTLDLDVKAVTVSGAVTLNGAPVSADSSDSAVLFTSKQGSVRIGLGAGSTYSTMLVAGSYDVGFQGDPNGCDGTTVAMLPCNSATVKRNASLTSNGTLDLDVPTVHLSGTVTLNGGAFPESDSDRGSLRWQALDGTATSVAFGSAGAAAYAVTLVAGRYVVAYDGTSSSCTTEDTSLCGGELVVGCN